MSEPWKKSVLRDYFESICIAVIFALFVRTFVVQAFKIPSSSMENNLLVGDHILVNKFAYAPHPGWMTGILPYRDIRRADVIVFKYPKVPSRDFIKRVIAIGGDTVGIRRGHLLRTAEPPASPSAWWQSAEPVAEPYMFLKTAGLPAQEVERRWQGLVFPPVSIPPGQYFVMGDNRLNSEDSRYWGTVPGSHLKGKALLIYWSFDVPERYKPVEVNSDAPFTDKGLSLGYTLLHFFDKTRWSRTFNVIH